MDKCCRQGAQGGDTGDRAPAERTFRLRVSERALGAASSRSACTDPSAPPPLATPQILIPRPGPPGAPPPPGLGKVLIEFADGNGAIGARNALHGRKFGGRTVTASLMLEQDYKEQRWD